MYMFITNYYDSRGIQPLLLFTLVFFADCMNVLSSEYILMALICFSLLSRVLGFSYIIGYELLDFYFIFGKAKKGGKKLKG